MTTDFHGVFTGEGMRIFKNGQQHFVHHASVFRRDNPSKVCGMRRLLGRMPALENFCGNVKSVLSADSDDSNGPRTRCRGNGCNGVVEARETIHASKILHFNRLWEGEGSF